MKPHLPRTYQFDSINHLGLLENLKETVVTLGTQRDPGAVSIPCSSGSWWSDRTYLFLDINLIRSFFNATKCTC